MYNVNSAYSGLGITCIKYLNMKTIAHRTHCIFYFRCIVPSPSVAIYHIEFDAFIFATKPVHRHSCQWTMNQNKSEIRHSIPKMKQTYCMQIGMRKLATIRYLNGMHECNAMTLATACNTEQTQESYHIIINSICFSVTIYHCQHFRCRNR